MRKEFTDKNDKNAQPTHKIPNSWKASARQVQDSATAFSEKFLKYKKQFSDKK